jgi:hypothetical protein
METDQKIVVKLVPMTVPKVVGNLVVQKSLNQDRVDIYNERGDGATWGYCPTVEGHGTFLPLSGFPKELVGEVQRQINEIRGFAAGEGPPPPQMLVTGRTAAEQAAEATCEEAEEDFDEEEYE